MDVHANSAAGPGAVDAPALAEALGRLQSTREIVLRIVADQRRRWRAGEHTLIEAYLVEQPDLQSNRQSVLDLVSNEVLLREEQGERPGLTEYVARFPHLATELASQFEVDAAIRHEQAATLDMADASCLPPRPSQPPSERAVKFARVPNYEIVQELGRGGMGVVYKARHLNLNRMVALKMILAGAHAGPNELARFRTEAEAVAHLQHPNIVQVYEYGAHEDRPYMALELVEGSLTKSLAGTPLPARQAAQWSETLARAVHYAHQRGVVHRDLKPANVLLSRDGVLKITDFGMAKMASGQTTGQTQTGAVLGSPCYMAPEQAEGKTRQIGPATDVYGLGAILYELLTGRPPFQAPTLHDTLNMVRLREPTPPSRLQAKLPRDLETICLRCLQKEPDKRYPSAEALADDLRAFLAGEPIRSRPAGPWERMMRWARRRPAEAVVLGAGAMACLGLIAGILWSSVLAAAAIAGLSLLVGSWLYSARLKRALGEVTRQQVLAERSVERLHLLLELTHRLIRTTQQDELLRLLAEITARLANAELATIYLVDRERREIWSKVTLDKGVGEIRLPLGQGIAGTVAATGEPINIPDAYADPRFNQDVDRRTGHKTRNLLTMSITALDGRILGVFQVINKQDGAFGLEDIEILASLASAAAIAIENALFSAKPPSEHR
jgi:putative methionine-R-sulfoxide reductase with GAF domain